MSLCMVGARISQGKRLFYQPRSPCQRRGVSTPIQERQLLECALEVEITELSHQRSRCGNCHKTYPGSPSCSPVARVTKTSNHPLAVSSELVHYSGAVNIWSKASKEAKQPNISTKCKEDPGSEPIHELPPHFYIGPLKGSKRVENVRHQDILTHHSDG